MIDIKTYDLEGRFEHWNDICFDSKLELHKGICFGRTHKTTNGVTSYIKTRSEFPFAKDIKIVLSNTIKYSQMILDKILIHEMIHVYFALNSRKDVGHGLPFRMMCYQLSKKVGFDIPEKSITTEPVLNGKYKEMYCILLDEGTEDERFALITDNASKAIPLVLGQLKKFKTIKTITYGKVNTNLHTVYPIRRSIRNSIKTHHTCNKLEFDWTIRNFIANN